MNWTPQTRTKRKNNSQLRDHLLMALIIIGVVALGLLAINQFLEYRYKAVWLSTPCDLCRELNPRLDICFNIFSTSTIEQFPEGIKIDFGNFTIP